MDTPVLTPEERDGFEKLFSAYYDCRKRRVLCKEALVRMEGEILELRARVEHENTQRRRNMQRVSAARLRAERAERRVQELEKAICELNGKATNG